MISIVFKEQDKSGVFTGKSEQFCSERCAEEWEQQGLAFERYLSAQEEAQSPLDQCAACLKWLQEIANDQIVINIRVAGRLNPDGPDSEAMVEQIRVMDFHLPGTPEAEKQLREMAV